MTACDDLSHFLRYLWLLQLQQASERVCKVLLRDSMEAVPQADQDLRVSFLFIEAAVGGKADQDVEYAT